MSYLKGQEELIKKVKDNLGDPQPIEFIELIKAQEVNKGSPQIEDDRPAKKCSKSFKTPFPFNSMEFHILYCTSFLSCPKNLFSLIITNLLFQHFVLTQTSFRIYCVPSLLTRVFCLQRLDP